MAKLIRNVGKYPGLNGTAVIYLAEDDAQRKFLVNYESSSSDPAVLGTAKFMARSTMESAIVSGNGAFIAKSVPYADLMETPSTSLLDSSNNVTISNARQGGGAYVRVWTTAVALYGIIGEGYATVPTDTAIVASATDVVAWKAGANLKTGTETTTTTDTSTGITNSAAKFYDEIVNYVNANPLIGGAMIAVVLYFLLKLVFGIDLLVELGLKKKGKGKRK